MTRSAILAYCFLTSFFVLFVVSFVLSVFFILVVAYFIVSFVFVNIFVFVPIVVFFIFVAYYDFVVNIYGFVLVVFFFIFNIAYFLIVVDFVNIMDKIPLKAFAVSTIESFWTVTRPISIIILLTFTTISAKVAFPHICVVIVTSYYILVFTVPSREMFTRTMSHSTITHGFGRSSNVGSIGIICVRFHYISCINTGRIVVTIDFLCVLFCDTKIIRRFTLCTIISIRT
mmetsp:Transcript_20596/g.23498  ORF Transcript_20596/g.23498 Transcript_20596/m.23498 type:complete len:229 (+) Transcript_20596:789-1475(+)